MKGLVQALSLRSTLGESGGVALVMLLSFMVLAVPIVLAASRTVGDLERNSIVWDRRLHDMYNGGSGVEVAIYQILSDPDFDDDLTEASPSKEFTVEVNGDTIIVTVTKIFSDEDLQGQGIVLSKNVTPTSALVNTATTFTYDIIIKNEGSDEAEIEEVYDYLPPGFTYLSGSTTGITTNDPTITSIAPATCGSVPDKLFWNITPSVDIDGGEELRLTLQATASLSDGTYYNQASLRYDPWWTSDPVEIYSPYTASVTVGTGDPKCGYDLQVLVTQDVEPESPTPGEPTEFTYTITVENVTASDTIYVCKIDDLLPPTFTYVTNSTGEYSGNIWTQEPEEEWQSASERWNLRYADGTDSALEPLDSIDPGQSKTQKFRASATPQSGVNYYNEVEVTWSKLLVGGKCNLSGGNGGVSYDGVGDASYVDPPTTYDIQAIAPDGTVQSRIVFYEADGKIVILSWEEY